METAQPKYPTVLLAGDKIDRMIYLLERLDRHFNPPLWQKMVVFTFNNFLTIVSLLILAYVTWQIWGVVSGVQSMVGSMVNTIGGAKLW